MIQPIIAVSLIITGIYIAFQDGNILAQPRIWIANFLDKRIGKKWSRYVQKPLWDCLPCMASIWTIGLFQTLDLGFILAIVGLNGIIERTFFSEQDPEAPADPLGPQINNHFK